MLVWIHNNSNNNINFLLLASDLDVRPRIDFSIPSFHVFSGIYRVTQRYKPFVVAPNHLPFSLLHFTVQKTIWCLNIETRVGLIHLLLDYTRWVPFELFGALLKPFQIILQWNICRFFKYLSLAWTTYGRGNPFRNSKAHRIFTSCTSSCLEDWSNFYSFQLK